MVKLSRNKVPFDLFSKKCENFLIFQETSITVHTLFTIDIYVLTYEQMTFVFLYNRNVLLLLIIAAAIVSEI